MAQTKAKPADCEIQGLMHQIDLSAANPLALEDFRVWVPPHRDIMGTPEPPENPGRFRVRLDEDWREAARCSGE